MRVAPAAVLLGLLLVGAHAVEFEKASGSGKQITVCRVNVRKERLELFLRDPSGQTLKTLTNVERLVASGGRRLTFAMNAGMYHADYAPVGLFISEGRQLAPLNTAPGEG